jgi:hypothetical protein
MRSDLAKQEIDSDEEERERERGDEQQTYQNVGQIKVNAENAFQASRKSIILNINSKPGKTYVNRQRLRSCGANEQIVINCIKLRQKPS